MQGSKVIGALLFLALTAGAARADAPQFGDFGVQKSSGPFANKLSLSDEQKMHSEKWRKIMQRELKEPVNFAGHYRVYLSWNGELPKECGDARWVCGWILDKSTGEVVSTLPEFNGNTAYFSYNDNGTPRPDEFDPGYYPNSTMLWINGSNVPAKGDGEGKCAVMIYNFKDNKFIPVVYGECEVDHGDDPNYRDDGNTE